MEKESMRNRLQRIDGYASENVLRTNILNECIEYIAENCCAVDKNKTDCILRVLGEYSKETEKQLNEMCEYIDILKQHIR